MAIDVDKSRATKLLYQILNDCEQRLSEECQPPTGSCVIRESIDFVLTGKKCLTYRYIMVTALVAKATDEKVDILSLQASDDSEGAYDARSLCSRVVFPFQRDFLSNALDGSNPDPLVNNPGRYPRLRETNATVGGDSKKALTLLCRDLPKVKTSEAARECVEYIVMALKRRIKESETIEDEFASSASRAGVGMARAFTGDLLGQGFGGAALVMVTAALYKVLYSDADGYRVVPHPVNQSGSSKRQISDVDVYDGDTPILATELKDKPFSRADVGHAVDAAAANGVKSVLFIGGRESAMGGQTTEYFDAERKRWLERGIYVGVMPIDALVDYVFATHRVDPATYLESIRFCAEGIGEIEALMWVYSSLK